MSAESIETVAALDMEQWFERESRSFKLSRGASGMQINAVECPACGDSRSRVYLNAETGVGNCFVCNETFNKAKFVHLAAGRDTDNKKEWAETFKEIRECVSEQGWRPKRMTAAAVEIGTVELPRSITLPTADDRNLVYLENRGISGEIARYFNLRYCDFGRFWFTKEDGSKGYQNFGDRLIIPVFDLDGKLATFQGRDVLGTKDEKYLFPKGLPGTGRYLLNGQNALRAKRVAMGEGFFDVAAMKIALDEEVSLRDVIPVGSFGKHLSYGSTDGNDQIGRFMQMRGYGLEEVTIMWDGEPKALVAALDAADLMQRIGIRVRLALLPAEKDPNEVPAQVVRDAFMAAVPYSKALAVKWRLRNPYKT